MSTDYEAVCHECKEACHLGQRMAMRYSFSYGFPRERASEPEFMAQLREEHHKILEWIAKHLEAGHRVEVMTDFPEDYTWEV